MDFTPKAEVRNTADGAASRWSQTYGPRHRLIRVTELPTGIEPTKKVRVYRRSDHYVLQWWDVAQKKTLSQRIDGDLLEAIVRARETDARLANYSSSGQPAGRVEHERLVCVYIDDLTKRCDAGEIDPRTVDRYSAPPASLLAVRDAAGVARHFRYVTDINRDFRLEFSRFLQSRHVSLNGNFAGATRPMRGQRYVIDVVRSMLHWAADAARGNLLPSGFQNPFRQHKAAAGGSTARLADPDITLEMAAEFLSVCDRFQLPIFGTLALYGLRPDELGWIFWEEIDVAWLRVTGHPELSYKTKGRRDKQFPILECLQSVWPPACRPGQGLVFHRCAARIRAAAVLAKSVLAEEFQRRRSMETKHSSFSERRLRDDLLGEAGQLSYDHVENEFHRLAKQLGWPQTATMKDFRHLFATNLENAGVPESYRRFLMGHSPGRAAIVTYTHLNKLREHYLRAVDSEFSTLIEAIRVAAGPV